MDNNIVLKVNELVKTFCAGLDRIEKDIDVKLKDAEKQINDNNRLAENLKIQEKENDKKWQVKQEKLTNALKMQDTVYKKIEEELTKQTNLTKDIEKTKLAISENLKTSEQAKKQSLDELDKQRKSTIELKSKIEEQEKLQNANIERSKFFNDEFNRINIKEGQLNLEKAKLESDKIDFSTKQNGLDLRIKNIEHIEKSLRVKNGV